MGMVEDWYHKEDEEDRRADELRKSQAAIDADARQSGIFLSVLFLPCVVVFLWKVVSGSFPFGAEVGDKTTLSQAMIGMYIFGALGTTFLGLLLALFVGFFFAFRFQRRA